MALAGIVIDRFLNNRDGQVTVRMFVNFFGTDVCDDATVAGPFQLDATVGNSASAVQIQNDLAAAVQAFATARGLTVANGDTGMGAIAKT